MAQASSNFHYETNNYKVFIGDDNFLHIVVWGKWTKEDALAWDAAIKSCATELRRRQLPVLVMYDGTNLDLLKFADNRETFKLTGSIINGFDFEGLAYYKMTPVVVSVSSLFSGLFPVFKKFHMCTSEAEAVKYLEAKRAKL
jgi:hypothetical protein